MNKLICSNGKNGTEHVNNFNANTPFNTKMLMQDCSTEWFGYHDSRHSKDEELFICVNGAVIDESLNVDPGVRTVNNFREHFSFTIFKLFGNWFNPSFRITVNHQTNNAGYGYIFGTYGSPHEK